MHRRSTRLAALLLGLAVVLPAAAPVAGWSNGPEDGNGYGTHDWILDQGLRILKAQGYDISWFDRPAALLKTDDPDTIGKVKRDHVYRLTYHRGGAIQWIAEYYTKALDAFQAHRYTEASQDIGLLSHYLGDVSQPFHTTLVDDVTAHHAYESAVEAEIDGPTDMPAWWDTSQPVSLVSNIRKLAVANAAYSRARFDDLYAAWQTSGSVTDATVRRITGEVLKRAGRDMASVIWSISRGVGRQPDLGTLRASFKWLGVDPNEDFHPIYVTALDVDGHPIEGLRLDFAWPACETASGAIPPWSWTDEAGYQRITHALTSCPMLVRQYVTVTATVNGETTTIKPWFMPSPLLPSGGAGFHTTISDTTPDVGQIVSVTSRVRNSKGEGVPGLKVWWTWDFDGQTMRTSALTDATGRARSSFKVTSSTTSKTVTITAHTQSHSRNRYSTTSFNRT